MLPKTISSVRKKKTIFDKLLAVFILLMFLSEAAVRRFSKK